MEIQTFLSKIRNEENAVKTPNALCGESHNGSFHNNFFRKVYSN